MVLFRILFSSIWLFIPFFSIWSESSPPRSIMFIFDASGSMNDRMTDSTRMKIAMAQLESFIKSLPSDTEMGLVAYGNQIPGCDSARLYSPLKKSGGKDILAKLPFFFPAGSTPIARTIELVGKHLLTGHSSSEIILISDGIESCDGDPVKEIQKIKKVNPNVKMHVLGLDVLKNEERELHYLANESSGKYFSVKNKKSMEDALSTIWSGKTVPEPQDPEIPFFPDADQPKKEKIKSEVAKEETKEPPASSDIPYIRVTNIEKLRNDVGKQEYLVWYEFEGRLASTEHTALLLFHSKNGIKAVQIPKLREKKAPSVFHAISVDHNKRMGKGYVRIQIADGSEISVSAELWESNTIPESVAISDEKNLSDAKSTETFDAIFR